MEAVHASNAFRTLGRPAAVLLALAVIGLTAGSAGARGTQRAAAPAAPKPVKAKKLDSALARAAATARLSGARAGVKRARELGLALHGSRVEVQVDAHDVNAAAKVVRAAGGTVVTRYQTLLDANVPAGALSRIAGATSVRSVHQQARPQPATVLDEAVATTGADSWLASGTGGSGVQVAIIDIGFDGWKAQQAAGELPASVTTVDYCEPGSFEDQRHGTAVAEVVHDMAPAAQLYLVCVDSVASLGKAKDYVVGKGIPIVNHSVGWFNTGRGDGNGPAATPDGIVADARAHGVLWVNSAGNERQEHWSGKFTDADANGWHDFGPGGPFAKIDEGNSFFLDKDQQVCAYLKWDDWPASSQDYDLYIYRESPANANGGPADKPKLVASSTNLQSGTQSPTESACFTNPSNALKGYDVAIRRDKATATPRFDLFTTVGPLQYNEQSGSLLEPAASPHALSVGAACWATGDLEPYSSQGPTLDGRTKPDLTGPDGVSTATLTSAPGSSFCFGRVGFYGTSAGAPHVTGAAALLKQTHPDWNPSKIQAELEGSAVDIGAPGKDDESGSGLLALAAAPPPPPAPPAPAGVAAGVLGTPQQGKALTATTGGWTGAAVVLFNYQWQRCTAAGSACADVAGALDATYKPVAADVGAAMRVVVTAFNAGGSSTSMSAPTAAVLPAGPENTAAPALGGYARQGSTLTTSLGTWSGNPSSYSVDWRRCDNAGAGCVSTGATGTSYAVVAQDLGNRMRAYVTATNAGGSSTAFSPPSSVVGFAAPENRQAPQVTGSARVGQTLTASTGNWVDAVSYSFRWWRCVGSACAYVAGATDSSFVLRATDAGATFRAVVTASNPSGTSTAHSEPTAAVAALAASPSLLAGTAAVSRKPVAGGTFTAKVALRRSDGARMTGVRVSCGAKVAGRLLHVTLHRFARSIATCTWTLPAWTAGKTISGTIRVGDGKLVAKRTFGARIGA
jgi:hypothetical protein